MKLKHNVHFSHKHTRRTLLRPAPWLAATCLAVLNCTPQDVLDARDRLLSDAGIGVGDTTEDPGPVTEPGETTEGETTEGETTEGETSTATDVSDDTTSDEPGHTGHPGHPDGEIPEHCLTGFDPLPTNGSLSSTYAVHVENEQADATVRPEVIQWMEEQHWQEAHFQWHQIRRCGNNRPGGERGVVDICQYTDLLPEANECENPQDGYEFLVMHRHMIQTLKQLWPDHADHFSAWERFPSREDYPEIVQEYFSDWNNSILEQAAIADNIEDHLDDFATEGELGMWLQCGSLSRFSFTNLHAALHFNGFPPLNQSHSVANGRRNLDSFIFWKLHGWIDNVWERYRIAKGLTDEDPQLQQELIAQCVEMHALAEIVASVVEPPDEPDPEEDLVESGFFHEEVRPALESFGCSTCHGAGEEAGLRLGFQVSSTEIVSRLVNQDSAHASGYKLVVPGEPEQSWLYLKASGLSATTDVECVGVTNCQQAMPPGGNARLPEEGLAKLREWIEMGAPAPTVE